MRTSPVSPAALLSAILLLAGCDLVQETTDPFATGGDGGGIIAFDSMRDRNNEVYVMDADGSNQIRLTNNPGFDSHPTWSPDGARIAFVSDRDGHKDIFVMNADGSNPINLTNNPRDDLFPAWMPVTAYSTRDRCLLCPGPGGPTLGF